jgi:hypothetical protein
MSILDAAILVGVESTYGTPASLTRAFEGKADAFKREQSRLESVGFRADMQTLRNDRVVTVNMGGAGSLEVDVLNKGMGMLLGGALGTKAGPTQQGSTAAYLQTYETSDSAPADSFTIQVIRPTMPTGTQQFTYHGCKITGWSLSQSVDGLASISFDFDFEDSDTATAAGTPAYPASATPFDWTNCTITLDPDGTPDVLEVRDLSFTADLALKTDRRFLKGSALKSEPVRGGVPVYSGEISVDFEDLDRYNEWIGQSDVDVEIKWSGAAIEGAYNYELGMRMKACHWTDGTPEASLSDTPVQTLPFQALHNGTDAAVSLTYQSTDTAV